MLPRAWRARAAPERAPLMQPPEGCWSLLRGLQRARRAGAAAAERGALFG